MLRFLMIVGLWLTATAALCAEPAAGKTLLPGDHVLQLRLDELDRHYLVHVPPTDSAATALPLVIMLHGGGGTSHGAATETGWSAKADKAGFVVAYPDATPPDVSKPGRFGTNSQIWNDGSGRFHAGQRKIDDTGFILAMIDDLAARLPIDRRRVFVTGFSNGASMAFRMGAEFSTRIAAIAPVAGSSWMEPLHPERGIPLCYITGDEDPLNPLNGGMPHMATSGFRLGGKEKLPVREIIMKWVKALGCPAEPKANDESNGVRTLRYGPGRDGAEVVFVTVAGLGHTWADGKSLLPESMVGKRTDKLNATDFIWEFFKAHPLKSEQEKPPAK